MKRFLVLAALVLGLASCQREPEGLDLNVGGEVATEITVSLPEDVTRAVAGTDSAQSDINAILAKGDLKLRYILQVFNAEGDSFKAMDFKYADAKSVVFPVRLVPNRHYRFVVWADLVENDGLVDGQDCDDLHYVIGTSLRDIKLADDWKAMDETRDAYTGYYKTTGNGFVGTESINITLTRPFAKLRVVTTDIDELFDGVYPHNAVVTYTTNHYKAFDAFAATPGDRTLAGKQHTYVIDTYSSETDPEVQMTLYTDYFFATEEDDAVRFNIDVKEADGTTIKLSSFNTDIKVKRNYLTTLIGDVLTEGNNVNVEVQPGLGGTENPDIVYNVITSGAELAQAVANGGSYKVGNNIYVADTRATTFATRAGAAGNDTTTINLNGYTITFEDGATVEVPAGQTLVINDESDNNTGGVVVENGGDGGFVVNDGGSLTVESGNIGAGAIENKGTVTLEGGNLEDGAVENVENGQATITNGEVNPEAVTGDKPENVTNYADDIKDAFEAGEDYQLVTDITIAEGLTLAKGKTMTLDLNGYTISQTKTQTTAHSMITNNGTLTIVDSKSNGKISYRDEGNGGEYVSNTIQNSGVLTIESGIIENNSTETVADNGYPHPVDNSGKLVINGGTFTNNANYSSMRIWCTTDDDTEVTINGGTFNGSIDLQTVNANANKGVLTINGGTFNADAHCGCAVRFLGFGVDVDEIFGYINGGTFNGEIKQRNYVGGKFNSQVFFVSGGSFSDLSALNFATENTLISLHKDVVESAPVTVASGKTVVLNLGGHSVSCIDNTEKNFQLIDNRGTLTVEGAGKMTVEATINSGWNRYSAVIANNPGGNLTVKGVTLEHLGGTDMAYGIDNLTNGKNTVAVTTVEGATIKSTYRAVRQFLNGVEATNELYVKAGSTLRGGNKAIFFQDPSKNANPGKLVVEEGAALYGGVYLFVTEGSTEWPVSVSVDASALKEGEVTYKNVPAGYGVIVENNVWKVVQSGVNNYVLISNADELVALGKSGIKPNAKVFMIADIDLTDKEFGGLQFDGTNWAARRLFDGQGHIVSNWTYNGGASDMGFIRQWVGEVMNINFDNCHIKTGGRSAIAAGKIYGNITNIHISNSSIEDSYWACGAIAGLYNAGSITNCTVTNSLVKSNGGTGGIVGVINEEGGTRAVHNCTVENSTINNTGIYGASYTGGGIVGLFNAADSAVYEITDCAVKECKLEGDYIYEISPEF